MCGVGERLEKVLHVLAEEGVMGDALLVGLLLLLVRQLSVLEQVSDL